MDLEIRLATTSDLKYIDHLQKKNAEDLAFYPLSGLEKEIERHRITLAIVNGSSAGYLYYGVPRESLKIHQACIEYDLRGQWYGAGLVSNLENMCKMKGCMSIRLRCASSLDSNGFWEKMGYKCTSVQPGGGSRMRDINVWIKNLQEPLFEIEQKPSNREMDRTIWQRRKKLIKASKFIRGKNMQHYRDYLIENDKQRT
jgi:GNAT superfamily N-acetyltransferase|tara:strand:- start:2180 stop:2776 length:597 start_codon:yes stop_codon:yes gene_type:complete